MDAPCEQDLLSIAACSRHACLFSLCSFLVTSAFAEQSFSMIFYDPRPMSPHRQLCKLMLHPQSLP